MEWITPIFDRTIEDVDQVLMLINVIQQDGWNNVDDDVKSQFLGELRGTFNKVTIERIINNTKYLEEKLLSLGYNPQITHQKDVWSYSDIPTITDLTELVSNLQNLIDCFYNITGTLPTDMSTLEFDEVNDMERVLYDINRYSDRVDKRRLYCGTVMCGQSKIGGFAWKTE